MNNNPKISVIVPVYKVEKYLDKCVESIVNQTYKNLEIILVDDGSPDNCPAMCDAWAEKDSRIRVIHKANGGVSSARNVGLDVATGEYIGFVDSDDWIESNMYETLLNNAVRHCAQISKCTFDRCYEIQTNASLKNDLLKCYFGKDSIMNNLLSGSDCVNIFCSIYSADMLKNIRFDNKLRIAEDFLFSYHVSCAASVKVISDLPLYHYFYNDVSVTNEGSADKWMDNLKVLNYIWSKERENKKVFDCLCNRYIVDSLNLIQYLVKLGHVKTEDYNLVRYNLISKRKSLLESKVNLRNKMKLFLFVYFQDIYLILLRKMGKAM